MWWLVHADGKKKKVVELYKERLDHYQDLVDNDDGFRDTVEHAESTGGVIDGGTWEHRKRAKEMLKTAESALEVTMLNHGKHHISQFLPKVSGLLKGIQYAGSQGLTPCYWLYCMTG